jgi:hypothetical protein
VTDINPLVLQDIALQIQRGEVVPFLGAGANRTDRPAGRAWEPGVFAPDGGELAIDLAEKLLEQRKIKYPEGELDLLRVSQYFDVFVGRKHLYGYLRGLFNAAYPPTSLHRFLAKLPPLLREGGSPLQLIITTNYDFALETAFDDAGEEYDLVWYEAKESGPHGKFWHRDWRPVDERPPNGAYEEPRLIEEPNNYNELSGKRTVILKLHGAIDPDDGKRDSFVITEDNYIDYLSQGNISDAIPTVLKSRLEESSFLFLGYSMRDWNLRVILNRIWGSRVFDQDSWAVQLPPDTPEKAYMEQKLWRARSEDTELIYASLQEFVTQLDGEVFGAAEVAV